mmetsp:Transcript_28690/g.84572  ORF Transcript_28690/g.84572 Transcript_28690/m.84572 type:complete len:204 (-) Transcript_28690:881-1492(-)
MDGRGHKRRRRPFLLRGGREDRPIVVVRSRKSRGAEQRERRYVVGAVVRDLPGGTALAPRGLGRLRRRRGELRSTVDAHISFAPSDAAARRRRHSDERRHRCRQRTCPAICRGEAPEEGLARRPDVRFRGLLVDTGTGRGGVRLHEPQPVLGAGISGSGRHQSRRFVRSTTTTAEANRRRQHQSLRELRTRLRGPPQRFKHCQ